MGRPGYRTDTAGLVVAQAVVLDTVVEHRMCVPSCLSTRLALRVSYLAVDPVVVVASFHSHVAEVRPALVGLP